MQLDFVKNCTTFLFDCDGVLWRSGKLIPGAVEVVLLIKSMGKKVGFITNNNSITRKGLCLKLNERGFKAVENECFCTSYLAAKYLSDQKIKGKVYLIGNQAISEELDNFNIKHFGLGVNNYLENQDPVDGLDVMKYKAKDVSAVLVGYDKFFSIKKIAIATNYLQNPDTLFVATNTDPTFPLPDGKVMPGTGTMVAGVKYPAQREPVVVGKPFSPMIDLVMDCMQFKKEDSIVIGDRLETDILFAVNANVKSILLFSGVTSKSSYESFLQTSSIIDGQKCIPTSTADSIADLIDYI